jgi:predicted transport protein
VYDGTFLDYGLLVAKRPALFCEAKPTRKSLDDPKWVSQTINYANNEGVVWCVLTDGLRWRVFKANEAAPMEKKLAFEVLVGDLFDNHAQVRAERLFACLTPNAVADGELSRLGTQVFVDGRVQETLIELLENPPSRLVELLRTQMGADHGLKPADVRGALARVVRPAVDALEATPAPVSARPADTAPTSSGSLTSNAGTASSHLHGQPARDISYSDRLVKWPSVKPLHDALLTELAGNAGVDERRLYLAVNVDGVYSGGVEVQKSGLMVRVPLDLAAASAVAPSLAGRLVDVTGKGRWAPGRTEVRITEEAEISHAAALLTAPKSSQYAGSS